MEKQPMHQYLVDLARHVLAPKYGPEAYYTSYQRHSFPFGKGQPYKTGADALRHAEAFAMQSINNACRVEITKMHGYGGMINTLKDDSEQRFSDPFYDG